MATASKKKAQAAGKATEGLEVISRVEGFRRGGRAWSTAVTVVSLANLSVEELEAIEAEPQLITHRVDMPEAA